MYEGVARLYEQLARSNESDKKDVEALAAFVKN